MQFSGGSWTLNLIELHSTDIKNQFFVTFHAIFNNFQNSKRKTED